MLQRLSMKGLQGVLDARKLKRVAAPGGMMIQRYQGNPGTRIFPRYGSDGDGNGLPAVVDELRSVPDGYGAGTDASALVGQAGRAGELRAGELPLDDAARAGEAPRVVPEDGFDGQINDHRRGRASSGFESRNLETSPERGVAAERGADTQTMQDRPATKGARYALIEADNLKPSHSTELRNTKDYPENFSRQDWTRADAEQRVQGIVGEFDPARLTRSLDDASGAPIVARDGIVEAGNARTIALKRVYQVNGYKADTYRQHLRESASHLGLDPAAVDQMKKPVLVRLPDELAARGVEAVTGDVQHSFAPGANYAPLINDAMVPVVADSVVGRGKPIRREDIIVPFAKDLGASIYTGRVNIKNALGFFRRGNEEVRIKRHADLEVTAHEMAHLIDSRVPALSNEWRSNKALRAELKTVSYDKNSVPEGWAESVRLWMTQPDILQQRAPMVFDWMKIHDHQDKACGRRCKKAQEGMTAGSLRMHWTQAPLCQRSVTTGHCRMP